MKQFLPLSVLLLFGLFFSSSTSQAQTYAHAGEYMTAMAEQYQQLRQDQWAYIKAVSRGRGARKVERKRQALLQTNREIRGGLRRMKPYEGDASLRDSVIGYLELCYKVLDEDFAEIVDLEAIAEDSYDLMEAYMAAKDAANDKLDEANDRLQTQQQVFAATHHVNLQEAEETKLSQRLAQAGLVFDYYNRVYLIFFKVFKQEIYLMEAVGTGNVSSLLQNQGTLLKFAEEGLAKLDTLSTFEGDASLREACRKALEFYKAEAEKDAPVLAEFFLKQETMQNLQQVMETKKRKDLTQEEVDQFNQAVEDFNAAVNTYNETNERLNKARSRVINEFNKVSDSFTSTHVR